MTPDPIVTALLPMLHKLCDGQVSIAIGGSRTKGSADRWSDLDVYLFSMTVLPRADRETVVSTLLPNVCRVTSWGCDNSFLEGGTDFTFALNREYFPGEKQLAPAMNKLSLRPQGLSERVRQILNPGMVLGRDELAAQASTLADLVAETKSLVLSDHS